MSADRALVISPGRRGPAGRSARGAGRAGRRATPDGWRGGDQHAAITQGRPELLQAVQPRTVQDGRPNAPQRRDVPMVPLASDRAVRALVLAGPRLRDSAA